VRNTIIKGIVAPALLGLAQPALADSAETKGGIKVKTDDGRFEASIGGRIHYDGNFFVDDDDAPQVGGTLIRRARLTLAGKAYGWEYKLENDFAGQNGTAGSGFRELNIATRLGPGKLQIGQFKPYRGLEELTSSNELTVMERGFASASGILGQQWVSGLGYLVAGDAYTAGLSAYNLGSGATVQTEGHGASSRVTFAPLRDETTVVHVGAFASIDNPHNGATVGSSSVRYAGRLGPSRAIGSAAADRERLMYGVEAAAALGPFFVQSEFVTASLDQGAATPAEHEVQAYYVMASAHLTGESKPYSKGVFKSVKPSGALGAVELVAKYDVIENKDIPDLRVTAITAGANYYVNPNVRFMLNYVMGTSDADTAADGSLGRDIDVVTARAQFSF
jgi:phosphate-selective porin OprO and OprP